MPPLPQNLTDRLFIDYQTGNDTGDLEHTLQVRYRTASVGVDGVFNYVLDVLNDVTAARLGSGWQVLRARYSAAGSDFSVPVTVPFALAAFVGTSSASTTGLDAPKEWRWVGRSFTSGRRVSMSLYGITQAFPNDFRADPSQSGYVWVGDVADTLNAASAAGAFLAVDGTPATWYRYANTNWNSYWERKARG